ncbi:DUF4386 domain-containing protein [Pedococcus sp. 2YAF34]|uniref:DUF4386 domain-containing protein n=1 Tax=Pedococcus sp. 2YAF34 TaxID=3233032 RepID=UPI003F97A898
MSFTRIPRSNARDPLSRRGAARAVGILFVVQMVTAMFGTSLIQAFVDGNPDRGPMTVGVALMAVSGFAVVAIGLVMYPTLKQVNPNLAIWYPILRIVECLVSAACGVYLLSASQVVPNHLLWVYIPTGIGGLVLCYLLYVARLAPRPIALLGLVGYAALTIGVPLDLLGALDMGTGAGMLLVAPGGLFELVFLPTWLIARGFRPLRSTTDLSAPALATAH